MRAAVQDRYSRFYPAILDVLREKGGSGTPKEVKRAVLERMNLDAAELQRMHRSGVNAVENEIAWARNTLREAGLLHGTERGRGVWILTEKGWNTHLSQGQARELRTSVRTERAQRRITETGVGELEPEAEIEEIEETRDLLSALKELPAAGFERFCQRLLRESGFSEVHVSGRSGDGGIDGHGILQVNELVSFRVLFQCKRYQGSIGPDQIRDFRGAMQGRTDKGIFITTGTFTNAAETEAVREGAPPIELVGGERLVSLMERLQLGVTPRTVFDVDETFFDEYR